MDSNIDRRLIEKYGERAFMYTEYPNMRFWKTMGDMEYRSALAEYFSRNLNAPLQLYVHFPYCHTMCWFCTCPVKITLDYAVADRYLLFLCKEISLLKSFFDAVGIKPNIREIHLGGGSPTYLKENDFDILVENLSSLVEIRGLDEFAIEIDPRRVKQDKVKYYHKKGINRISFGVQDFDVEVQRAVGRVQPAGLTERLLTPEIRSLFSNGINFDIICGLPSQTKETMRRTMEKVVELAPDRVCFNYLHYRPELFLHQKRMEQFRIPNNLERKELFLVGLSVLTENGYLRTGYDHFAKPTDNLVRSLKNKKIQWNRLGPATGRYESVIAVGISGQTTLWPDYYFQNVRVSNDDLIYKISMEKYESDIEAGKFPIFHGYRLSEEDMERRKIINSLRNYFEVQMQSPSDIDIPWQTMYPNEYRELLNFVSDGIVDLSDPDFIRITEIGQQFADKVCEVFDKYKYK